MFYAVKLCRLPYFHRVLVCACACVLRGSVFMKCGVYVMTYDLLHVLFFIV